MIPPGGASPGASAAPGTAASPGSSARGDADRIRGDNDVEVLIVGGGVAGCSLAYRLATRGSSVRLLERGELASLGASAVGAALLNPYRGRSGKPGPHDLAGLDAFWNLVRELEASGMEPGAHRSGVIRVASNERQARSWEDLPGLERLAALPPGYRAPHGAFLVETGGWVEPPRLIAALAALAARRGARFDEGFEVERIEGRPGSWRACGSGGSLSARVLVLCLGAGEVDGVSLPEVERVAGDQVTLRADVDLPYPIAGPVYLAGKGGLIMVGGNHRAPGTEDPAAPELLRASAARMVPALAVAGVERVWTGVRAKRPDNVPLGLELMPGLWYLGAFGGRGFLTAPLLAERLAKKLSGDD